MKFKYSHRGEALFK